MGYVSRGTIKLSQAQKEHIMIQTRWRQLQKHMVTTTVKVNIQKLVYEPRSNKLDVRDGD